VNIAFVCHGSTKAATERLEVFLRDARQVLLAPANRACLITDEAASLRSHDLPERLRVIEAQPTQPDRGEVFVSGDLEYSYRVLRTLRNLAQEGPLDAIQFSDFGAEAFATLRAKRLLNDFPHTSLVVKCLAPKSLGFNAANNGVLHVSRFCEFYMEDYCARHADAVIAASPELAGYFQRRLGRADIRLSSSQSLSDICAHSNGSAGLDGRKLRTWSNGSAKKVSVVIPFFNQGQFLGEAIQSVRNSGYPHLEIIVVNDGSSNPAANEVYERTEGVVKLCKANGGLSSARNAGIRIATGDYVLMLDADDKIQADYIRVAVEALENNPSLSYVTCHARLFGAVNCAWVPVGFVPEAMLIQNTGGCCANVYRREAFAACGFYDETMAAFEDWDFLLKLAEHGLEGDVLPEEYFLYRRHPDSMLVSVAQPRRIELIQHLMLKHPRLLEQHASDIAVVLAGLWKQEEIRTEALRKAADESGHYQSILAEHGLIGPHVNGVGGLRHTFLHLLGKKTRRSLRRRMATMSRWLLTED
jgi:hypothetical protein